MKKIVVFSNMYPSKEHPTYGIFVKNQVNLLQNSGLSVDIQVIDNPGRGKAATLQKYIGWLFKSLLYLLKNGKGLSLSHAHYAFPTGLISLIGKKLMDIPYVVTVHGGDIDKMAAKNNFIANLTKSILQQADAVIVVGEKLKEDVIQRFGVIERRVHVMSMGVNTAIFRPIPKIEARNELAIPQNQQVILYVGNVIKAKGLLELIAAFEMLKKDDSARSLYIIGSQKDQAFVAELRKLINEKNLPDIHFQEPLGQANLARWMAASEVLVLPSHHEGFGLVALEAMASGTTVVGTNVGGLSYLLNDGAGVLVEPKNAPALAKGIQAVLDAVPNLIDEPLVKERVNHHSYESILQQLLLIYEKVEKK
ncbi:glycosyltransferase [Sporosarcina sp. HYO08]|uniref:glycosyltransferase n=1 Tax=Sporosarcina sp. HYO08 TaxID=1759557 RepID=UPI0007972081|nr:glycosyltransferase [Sporosarcina sp. HYO08]KXH84106.1 hypothetical protein AU377_04990 [Sporosarcina sp. HYO08]